MTNEFFIGIARAPGGEIGSCVCIDGLGRHVACRNVGWSAGKIRELVAGLMHEVRGDSAITIGLETESCDAEVEEAIVASHASAKLIEKEVVDALWRCMHRRKQTTESRALLIAQLLLLADYPPVPLEAGGYRPERW